ncbi:MAG: methyltransferase [Bacteroidetes bacterium]|nr:methyltransferase [Bacteroidota bacterium]
MRKLFKRFVSFFLIPLTRWYLRKDRRYTFRQVTLHVPQGVFHPGLFYSTKFLLNFLLDQNLKGKTLLELGGGSGLIAIHCAKSGADVTVTDLSRKAITAIETNSALNSVALKIVSSDVFDQVPLQQYDWIVVNPPYYANDPIDEAELAWHCGKDFEYFRKFFTSLGKFTSRQTRTVMVLTLGCDLEAIFAIAERYGFKMNVLQERNVLFDGKDFLFEITAKNAE